MNDVPKLGEFKYPYPKNRPTDIYETNKGIIIEIEGLDGSGKSTQTKMLIEKLKEKNEKVFNVNFIHSEYLREILLKTKWENCDKNTFIFMYMMGLSYTYYREIIPKLRENYIIVLDRYIYTIISKYLAYSDDFNDEWIKKCLSIFRKPDVKIYINTPIDECLKRKQKENDYLSYWECGSNIFYSEILRQKYDSEIYSKNFLKYQSKINKIFLMYVNNEQNWIEVNGNMKKEELSQKIFEYTKKKIEERKI